MSKSITNQRCFNASFKIRVVEEALHGDVSEITICRKYSLSSTILYNWIRIFAPQLLLVDDSIKRSKCDDSDVFRGIKREFQRKELELLKKGMRADFYDKMIPVAEEMFNISIRKKLAPNSKAASCKVLCLYSYRTLQTSGCF